MKKLLLSIFTISFFVANSQFIIEESDFATQGDVVIYATDSSFIDNTGQLGVTGKNVTWDYSNLAAIREDSIFFEDPNLFTAGGILPSSTISYNQNVYQNFLKINSTEVKYTGYSTRLATVVDTNLLPAGTNLPDDIIFKYDKGGLLYLNLDAQYGDTENGTNTGTFTSFYGDTFLVPGFGNMYIDSFSVIEEVTYTSNIDGDGTLMLPDGDYYTIRQNVNYKKDYSIEVYFDLFQGTLFAGTGYTWTPVPGVTFTIDETNYRFFGKSQKFPALEISLEANGAFTISRYQTNPHGSQVGINTHLENEFNCYVSNNRLNINSKEIISSVEVIDITGKVLDIIKINSKIYNSNFNHKGIYSIRVITSDNVYSTKVIN